MQCDAEVHLMRAVSRLVRPSDRKAVLDALKRVYRQENAALARQELAAFLNSYGTKYKRLHKLFQNEASLFSFYEFPKSIQQTIYTSNLIENNNKGFRHKAKLKEQFPNADSLERFACMVYCDYNRRFSGKAHRGFQEAYSELLEMFAD
ncbi:transposase [Selenomonas montiformis]|uniref:transposase n=1 Tax=Selenomonas montiformis TaxID=2652285 RepID=UPI003F88C1A3